MFETTLVASRKASAIRNPKLLPVAFLVHGLLAAGVLTASYWNVEEVAEPDTYTIIPLSLEPVLPAAEPAPAPLAPAPTPTAPMTPPTAAPVEAPPTSLDQIPATPPPIDSPVASVVQGSATTEVPSDSDSGPGCPGCVGPGPIDGNGGITHVLPGMTPPEAISRVLPTYTEAARRAGIQGEVVLLAIIGADGSVHGARVLKSLPMGLDQQALDAVQRWKFRPARRGQQPKSVYFTLKISFELR